MSVGHSIPQTHCYHHHGEAVELPIQTPPSVAELPASIPPATTTETSSPCSNGPADKKFFIDMDCTHSKLIVFLITYLWFSTDLQPEQRNRCPTCLSPYSSFRQMMIHFVHCPKAADGEYWCWDCRRWETFQQSRCRENRIPGNTSKPGMLSGFKKAVQRAVGIGLHRSGDASDQLANIGRGDPPLHQLHLDLPGGSDVLVDTQIQTFMNRQDGLSLFGQMHHPNDSGVMSSANTHSRPSSELVSPVSTVSIGSRPGLQLKSNTWPAMTASHPRPSPSTEVVQLPAEAWQHGSFAASMGQNDNLQLYHHCAPQAPPASTVGFALPRSGTVASGYQQLAELEGGQYQQAAAGVQYQQAVELAAANAPAPAYPSSRGGSLQGPLQGSQPLSRSSRTCKLWETFSENFGEMSGNPIRGQDPGEALINGLHGLQMILSGTGQLIPRMLIGLTHLIAAMAAQVAQDLPPTLYNQALSGVNELDPMHPGAGNIEAMKLIAGYYLDALEIQSHLDRLAGDPCEVCSCTADPHQRYGYFAEAMATEFYWYADTIRSEVERCKHSPPRHMELSLLHLYVSKKLPLLPDDFFRSYLPRTQFHIESTYCDCEGAQRLSYRLRTLDKIRQELSHHTTPSPSPDPVPIHQRQPSWDSSTAVESNVDVGHPMGSPSTLSGSPSTTYLDESAPDGTPHDLPCPFSSCKFSSKAAGRIKILRRHVQMCHLPVEQVFVCKHVGWNGTPCGKEYKRKDYVDDHWRKKHTGTLCMERVMRVRESNEFESDPNRILVLNRGRGSLWHLGPYWDVV